MKKQTRKKVLAGALIGGALAVAAGMMLLPESVKKEGKRKIVKAGKTLQQSAVDFYKFVAPQLKKFKHVGEREYKAFIAKSVTAYGKARKLSAHQVAALKKSAEAYWTQVQKHL